jgi:hypothetical protein
MDTTTRIAYWASSFPADTGGYRKVAIILLVTGALVLMLLTLVGKAARIEAGAQLAVSRACELLHEADKENRKVRPVPLSLADAWEMHGASNTLSQQPLSVPGNYA